MRQRGSTLLRAAVAGLLAAGVPILPAPGAGAGDDPRFGEQWALPLIGAPAAWSVATGSGITIAVVDTGVDLGHEDLTSKVLPGRNVLAPGAVPQDDNGHGTHVAGTAAAATGNGMGVAGTAPGASILPVKVLNARGTGSASNISEGIRWAADHGAQVINLSLGPNAIVGTVLGSGFEEAIEYAWEKGAVVVIAAGNDFLLSSSARDIPAIVVTATTRQDRQAGYASDVGEAKWGMAAPGGAGSGGADDVLSTYWERGSPNAYGFEAGTSMAAPHVSGAAAVLRSMGLSPQQTVDRLLATARDVGPRGPDTEVGAGRLDLACAVGRCAGATATTTTTGGPGPGGGTGTQPAGPGQSADGSSGPGPAQPAGGGSPGAGDDGAVAGAGAPAAVTERGAAGRAAGSRRAAGGGTSGGAAQAGPAAPGPAAAASPPAPADPPATGSTTAGATGSAAPLDARRSARLGSSLREPAGQNPRPELLAAAGALLALVAASGLRLHRSRRTF